jgi:hypothetical protein
MAPDRSSATALVTGLLVTQMVSVVVRLPGPVVGVFGPAWLLVAPLLCEGFY